MAFGDLPQGRHVGALAEQVNHQDGPGARGDLVLDLGGIEVVSQWIDVHEYRTGAGAADAAGGGEEGEGGQDDLVAWTDFQAVQGQRQRIGAGAAADAVAGAAVGGHFFFQGGDLRPENDLPRGENARQGGLDLRLQFRVLGLEVAQGDPGGGC